MDELHDIHDRMRDSAFDELVLVPKTTAINRDVETDVPEFSDVPGHRVIGVSASLSSRPDIQPCQFEFVDGQDDVPFTLPYRDRCLLGCCGTWSVA